MIKLSSQLALELKKRGEEADQLAKLEQKQFEQAASKMKKLAEAALAKQALREMLLKEEQLAHEFINLNKQLTLDDLPESSKRILEQIEQTGTNVCGSCRYSYGCLRCNLFKAQRYYLGKEAKLRGVPMPKAW